MKAEYINPFLTSTVGTFQTMLGCTLVRGMPFVKNDLHTDLEISGVIGLSGKAQGTVVLSLSRAAAIATTAMLLEAKPTEIDADVTDTVGELTNIIAGGAKAQLEHLELSLSLPTVVVGRSHSIEFPRKVTPICIPFDSEWGSIQVQVGIAELPEYQPDRAVAAAQPACPS